MNTLNEMNQTHNTIIEESNEVIAKIEKQLAECDELLKFCGINLNEEV